MVVNEDEDGVSATAFKEDEGETTAKNCDKGEDPRFYRLIIPYNL